MTNLPFEIGGEFTSNSSNGIWIEFLNGIQQVQKRFHPRRLSVLSPGLCHPSPPWWTCVGLILEEWSDSTNTHSLNVVIAHD